MFVSLASCLLLPGIVHSYNFLGFSGKSNLDEVEVRGDGAIEKGERSPPPIVAAPRPTRKNNTKSDRVVPPQHHDRRSRLPHAESTLSAGLFHTCAIVRRVGVECGGVSCGPAKCWGHDDRGQSSPPPGVMFHRLSAGGSFTCGLRTDGRATCWGEIDHPPAALDSLSREERLDVTRARRMRAEEEGWRNSSAGDDVIGGGHYSQVSGGSRHACAISRDDFEVHCWGRDDYGESSPPGGAFVQVSAGHSFTCGIRPNGAVECWGKNDAGQSSPPSYPENVFQQVSVSLGGDHACGILLEDGDIRCWGDNGRGQSENQDGNFLQVSAGTRTTCAVSEETDPDVDAGGVEAAKSTTIHCWGSRAHALLDHLEVKDQTNDNSYYHSQISLGQDHACASGKNADESLALAKTSLDCWWMAGSDFNAHRVPVGLEMVG